MTTLACVHCSATTNGNDAVCGVGTNMAVAPRVNLFAEPQMVSVGGLNVASGAAVFGVCFGPTTPITIDDGDTTNWDCPVGAEPNASASGVFVTVFASNWSVLVSLGHNMPNAYPGNKVLLLSPLSGGTNAYASCPPHSPLNVSLTLDSANVSVAVWCESGNGTAVSEPVVVVALPPVKHEVWSAYGVGVGDGRMRVGLAAVDTDSSGKMVD